MKYVLFLLAMALSVNCANMSRKCPVNSVPPSPTHEELIKQETHNAFVVDLDKAAQKYLDNVNATLRTQGIETAYVSKVSITVIDGSEEPLGVVEAVLINRTQKIGYIYFIFAWVVDDWEFRDSIPVTTAEEEMGL